MEVDKVEENYQYTLILRYWWKLSMFEKLNTAKTLKMTALQDS